MLNNLPSQGLVSTVHSHINLSFKNHQITDMSCSERELLRIVCFLLFVVMAKLVIYKTSVYSFFRYEVEIVSTGEVKEYSASANYDLQREGNGLIDTLKFALQAEGKSLKNQYGLAQF